MSNEQRPRPAVLYLRMSRQLREGLRQAADAAGCSLNGFAVQVLATAVGDPSRFRVEQPDESVRLQEIERDGRGFPVDWKERRLHMQARDAFITVHERELGGPEGYALTKRIDVENPAYFVEWFKEYEAERAARESGGHLAAG